MSENLSFTQELRQKGLIASDDETVTVSEDTTRTNEEIIDNTTEENYEQEPTVTLAEGNIMYIGKKPSMNYVLAINSRMNNGLDEVTVKARGRTISKAVDIAEIVTNRFVSEANDNDVKISTEEITRDDGTKTNVSTIEIVIKR